MSATNGSPSASNGGAGNGYCTSDGRCAAKRTRG